MGRPLTSHLNVAVDGKVVAKLVVTVVFLGDKETGAQLAISIGHAANLVHQVRDVVEFSGGVVWKRQLLVMFPAG